jgi:hypothetical protein
LKVDTACTDRPRAICLLLGIFIKKEEKGKTAQDKVKLNPEDVKKQ